MSNQEFLGEGGLEPRTPSLHMALINGMISPILELSERLR